MPEQVHVAIVGGGIGGLATAIALRSRGMGCTVYEQADAMREVGAGVGLGPNAWPLLARLGLESRLHDVGVFSTGTIVRRWDGERVPAGAFGIGSCMCHRAELQKTLADALPPGTLQLDHRLTSYDENEGKVYLAFANGERAVADALIGADGIHSVVRSLIAPVAPARSEGIMAYRGLIPMKKVAWASEFPTNASMWTGPGRSFLTYPVAGGRLFNIVAFVPTDSDAVESWSAKGTLATLAAEFEGWDALVTTTIAAMPETFCTGIFDRDTLPTWVKGRVALTGDAAHAMVPHIGQGASQAIEDAFALAAILDGISRADLPQALVDFEHLRLPRTSRVQQKAREAGSVYRLEQADRLALKQEVGDLDWIYKYDVIAAAQEMRGQLA